MRSQHHINTVNPTSNKERFMGWMLTGWLMAGFYGILLSWAFGESLIGDAMGWVIGGAIGGLVTGYALTLLEPRIQKEQIVLLTLGWAITLAFFEAIVGAIGDTLGIASRWAIGWAIVGAIGGLVTGYILIQVEPRIQKKQIAILTISIAAGWAAGGAIAGALGEAFSWIIGWVIAGATMGGMILWCLNQRKFDLRA